MLKLPLALTAAAATILALPLGCTAILDIPDPVTAYRWCLDADPALGSSQATGFIEAIQDDAGNWMRGCTCYCPSDHELMVLGANGQLVSGSDAETFYLNEVEHLRAKALLACTNRVLEMQTQLETTFTFSDPGTITCAVAVDDEEPYYATECVLDTDLCPEGGGGGGGGGFPGTDGPPDTEGGTGTGDDLDTGTGLDTSTGAEGTTEGVHVSGPVLYGYDDWADVITCPTPGQCDVDAAFVADLLEGLSILADDDIRIRPAATSSRGHQGFLFTAVGPDSLPAALGIRRGDLLWDVNGIRLTDFAAVGEAFEALNQTTTLTARFDRNGQTISLGYTLVSND